MIAARLQPFDRRAGHTMRTHVSPSGAVYRAGQDGAPSPWYVVDAAEAAALTPIPQFEVVEVPDLPALQTRIQADFDAAMLAGRYTVRAPVLGVDALAPPPAALAAVPAPPPAPPAPARDLSFLTPPSTAVVPPPVVAPPSETPVFVPVAVPIPVEIPIAVGAPAVEAPVPAEEPVPPPIVIAPPEPVRDLSFLAPAAVDPPSAPPPAVEVPVSVPDPVVPSRPPAGVPRRAPARPTPPRRGGR